MKKKIFFWSPMLSHIGTHQAVLSMAEALTEYRDDKVYLINVFGEFDDYNNSSIEKINLLKIKITYLTKEQFLSFILFINFFIDQGYVLFSKKIQTGYYNFKLSRIYTKSY